MPLQMYAVTFSEPVDAEVDFDASELNLAILHSWREHHDLHAWMERLYHAKGGCFDPFEDANVVLTAKDIDRLEDDIVWNRLPIAHGIFLDGIDPSDAHDLLLFTGQAREVLSEGLTLAYSGWRY